MTECVLALFAGRAATEGQRDGRDGGQHEQGEDEESSVAIANVREDQQLDEEARRIVGAELVAEALIVLRRGGPRG